MSLIQTMTNGPIRRLQLNRPPYNPLSGALLDGLESALDAALADGAIRVVVITGSGNHAFSAGADIKEFPEVYAEERLERTLERRHALLNKIERSPKPVIAALNGTALGGGMELAMACHFRLAVEAAVLGLPEVALGILPGWAGTQRLTRLVGASRALELMCFGEPIHSFRALELGLLHRVFKPTNFYGSVMSFAEKLAAQAPLAVAEILRAVTVHVNEGFDAGCRAEREGAVRLSKSQDVMEGVSAFIQKRKPIFQGK